MHTFIYRQLFFVVLLFSLYNLQAQPGQIDTSFLIGNSAANTASIIEVLPNGKIILGEDFTSFNGQTVQRIVRLNQNGTHDLSFPLYSSPGGVDGPIRSSELQADGMVIIGGLFDNVHGVSLKNIARLDTNGLPDQSFAIGTGANNEVLSISSNGNRILLAGFFSNWNGVNVPNMVCILPDGSIDQSFALPSQSSVFVNDLQLLPNGKSYIAGGFTSYNGSNINRLVKLNYNGSIDTSFNIGSGFNSVINRIAVQNDGKVILAGNFTTVNGVNLNRIARLNTDGNVDTGFNPGTAANAAIRSVSIQSDGKIIIGGDFTTYNGIVVNRIARLHTDGSLDNTFMQGSGTNGSVLSSKIQNDGKILICGTFTLYNNVSKRRFLRLDNDICINDNQPPVPLIANLPVLSEVCSANITTIPQAMDNCAGLITATTNSPLTYNQPGIYTINWVYTDNNNNSTQQTQLINITTINSAFSIDTLVAGTVFQLTPTQIVTNYNYTWINCNTNTIVSDSSVYSLQSSGSYALIVNYGTCSDTSACVQINMITLGSGYSSESIEISFFPNPATDFLKIENIADKTNIEIFSMDGKLQKSLTVSENGIVKINELAEGIYFIKFQNDKGIVCKKFIKNKQ
jgi:uncharacterized delta-60 repeat protein